MTAIEGKYGSHDSHMTSLEEKLLECELRTVAEYIVNELCAKRRDISHLGLDTSSHVTTEVGVATSGVRNKGIKRTSSPDSSNLTVAKRSAAGGCGHVTRPLSHVTSSVECWRRGQYFINGR